MWRLVCAQTVNCETSQNGEAITAYYQILKEKKKGKTTIDRQFEYNTYIRDFFADNKGKSLEDAIQSMLLGTFMLIPGIIVYY